MSIKSWWTNKVERPFKNSKLFKQWKKTYETTLTDDMRYVLEGTAKAYERQIKAKLAYPISTAEELYDAVRLFRDGGLD